MTNKLYYSKSTNGFYDSSINGENIPQDAVEISTDKHQDLLAAQSSGKVIKPDNDGNPVAVDYILQPSDYKVMAQNALTKSDITLLRCTERGVALPAEWISYRSTLRAIIAGQAVTEIPSHPAYPSGE